MTISKGAAWGKAVDRPGTLRLAADDRELAAMLSDGTQVPTAVRAGDMFRTLGARAIGDRTELLAFPVDLVEVRLDDAAPVMSVSHVLARSPWWRGGWWRGQALAVMNAEFVGEFDVAPRGHPNDGRVETFLAAPDMNARQRLEVRNRLPSARHLPHPQIATRPVRAAEWAFETALEVTVDGVRIGRGHRLRVAVIADAAVLYA